MANDFQKRITINQPSQSWLETMTTLVSEMAAKMVASQTIIFASTAQNTDTGAEAQIQAKITIELPEEDLLQLSKLLT